MNLPREHGDDHLLCGLSGAVDSRYYRMVQEFNTRKSYIRNEPIEEYTEGRQKFYCKNIEN